MCGCICLPKLAVFRKTNIVLGLIVADSKPTDGIERGQTPNAVRTLLVTKISSRGMPESRTARPTSASLPYTCGSRTHGDLWHHPWKAAALGRPTPVVHTLSTAMRRAHPACVTHLGCVDVPVAKLEGAQHRIVGLGAGFRFVHACKAITPSCCPRA